MRDTDWDSGGTMSLKALADITLERVTTRDSTGTRRENSVPTPVKTWDTSRDAPDLRDAANAAVPRPTSDDEPELLHEWRAGIARIDPDRPPKGYPPVVWHQMHRDGHLFLSTWGTQTAQGPSLSS